MISLYRTVVTTETYLLANRPEDAVHTVKRSYPAGKSITQVVDARAELVAEVRDDARALYPGTSCYLINADIPAERSGWTCAQWAAALPGDVAAEAARLREEAAKAEATVAGLRARAAALEALAQPRAPVARDPALDGDAKSTAGDHEPLCPDMFGGTDYPEVG